MANSAEPIERRVWAALDRGDTPGTVANDVDLSKRTVQRYAAARSGFAQGFKGWRIKGVAPWTMRRLGRLERSYESYRNEHPRSGTEPGRPSAADRMETDQAPS